MVLAMVEMLTTLPHVLIPARTPKETEKFLLPDKREESIANAEGQLLDESGNTENISAMHPSSMLIMLLK